MVRRLRSILVLLHLATGFGWLAAGLAVLLLGWHGERAAALRVDDLLLADLSFMTVYTGLMLAGLGPWGYTRHRWVLVKLGLAVGCALGGRAVLPGLLAAPGHELRLVVVVTVGALALGTMAWLGRTKPGARPRAGGVPPCTQPTWYVVALVTPVLDYTSGLPLQGFPAAAVLARHAWFALRPAR